MKALRWLDEHFEESLLIALLAVIAIVELMQVTARNVPFIPALKWAEELCRFCWVASVFISLPYTIRKGTMLRVTVLADSLPPAARGMLDVIVDIVTTVAMGLLAWFSVGVFQNVVASAETSPAMLMPMWWLYLVVLLGFTMGFLRGIQQAVLHLKLIVTGQLENDGELSAAERRVMAEAAEEIGAVAHEFQAEAANGKGGDE